MYGAVHHDTAEFGQDHALAVLTVALLVVTGGPGDVELAASLMAVSRILVGVAEVVFEVGEEVRAEVRHGILG